MWSYQHSGAYHVSTGLIFKAMISTRIAMVMQSNTFLNILGDAEHSVNEKDSTWQRFICHYVHHVFYPHPNYHFHTLRALAVVSLVLSNLVKSGLARVSLEVFVLGSVWKRYQHSSFVSPKSYTHYTTKTQM